MDGVEEVDSHQPTVYSQGPGTSYRADWNVNGNAREQPLGVWGNPRE
jgi:hypothetical protein